MEFLLEANASVDCTQTPIYPTPVVETAYVTLTPDVLTAFVTLTPDAVTVYTTLMPKIQTQYVTLATAYVTISPEVQTAYVTTAAEVRTAFVTVTPSPVHDVITTTVKQTMTVTASLSQSCSPAELTVTPALITTNVPPTHTEILTLTQTQTATATVTLSLTSTLSSPQPSASTGPSVTLTTTTDSTTTTTTTITTTTSDDVNNLTPDMAALVRELTLNPNNVSRARRLKESAGDVRTSAKTMGAVAGIVLTLVALLIVGADASRLFGDIQRLHRAVASSAAASDV